MRRLSRRGAVAVLGAGIALVVATASAARPAANDVGIQVGIGSLGVIEIGKTTVPRDFSLSVVVSGDAPAPVTVNLKSSPALQLGTPAQGSAGTCSGTSELTCNGTLSQTAGGTYALWSWRVISAEPGDYAITGSATSPEADPDLSNNSRTFRFQVAAPTSGGGGGAGGGGSGGSSVTASRAKLFPAQPKAGMAVVATVRVTKDGSAVRPSRVTCAAKAGATTLRGKAKAASGSASCTFKTPASAKGASLHGTVTVSARGKTIRRTFSARLR
jgi:hypothetical protein